MVIDLFGIAKRRELLKAALKREIERELQPSSRSYLQDWDARQEKEGRTPKISYRHLEAVYRRESWVRSCTDVIQRTATSNGYRLIGKDTLELVDPHSKEFSPIISLLARPNADDTFEEILAEVVVDLHLYGDAYVEIVRDTQGNPVAIYNIYAPSIRVLVDEHGTVKGYVQKPMGMLSGSSQVVTFKANEVAHFRLPNPGNEVYGLSPIESLEIVIETDLYAQDYNRNFFKNHAVPRLHVDLGNCTLPQLKRIREYFAHEIQGTENAHKTIVTEGGAKITPIGTKPNDMEFLNQRKFSRDEICLLGDTEIITDNGLVKIKDIKIGDKVLTHTGKFKKVINVTNRPYKGKMYKIESKGFDEIVVTPNHPILTLGAKPNRGHKINFEDALNWKNVEDVICRKSKVGKDKKHYNRKKFDNTVFPKQVMNNTNYVLDLSKFNFNNIKYDDNYIWNDNPNSNKINRFIKVDANLGKLIGYYLAEGFVGMDENPHQFYFTFSIKEQDYAKDVKRLLKSIFNLNATIVEKKDKNVVMVRCNSAILSDFLLKFGHTAKNKHLVSWCYLGNFDFMKNLVDKIVCGDGHEYEDGYGFTTISKSLAWQIRLLLFSFGKYSSLHKSNAESKKQTIMGRQVNVHDSYELRWKKELNGKSSINLLDKYVASFINKKEVIEVDTVVYNLEVSEDNSYVTLCGIVHNCSVFGVPPMKLGVFEDVNRASSMEADKSFKSEKIIPLQRMLAKKINSSIISTFNKIGDKVLFEFIEVDLRDAKEQAEIDKIEIDSGVLTVDEVRRKKGLGPKNKKKA
jgi:HK97 family phage portal protein